MDIICVGIGGNGQSFFMRYLESKSFKINQIQDFDGLKHLSTPINLDKKNKKCKIIYVFNKSFEAICSHYKRKWAVRQMNKIKIENRCKIMKMEDFFNLTEKTLSDHFGCRQHFLEWYKHKHQNGIYFINLSNINKKELSKFLECDESVFDNLNLNFSHRNKYNYLKNNFPLTNIIYKSIDDEIQKLSNFHNHKYLKT